MNISLNVGGGPSSSSSSSSHGISPVILEREKSGSSTSSGSKKQVQFHLENNQFCESKPEMSENLLNYHSTDNIMNSNINTAIANNAITPTVSNGDDSNYHSGSILISRNTSPFRPGGRGSKMLAKAIEQSYAESDVLNDLSNVTEPRWVLCTGKNPCFGKVMSLPSPDSSSVFIQPLHRSVVDPALLVPWEGHLWLAKSSRLHEVKMKQEPGGWRVIDDPKIRSAYQRLENKNSFVYPISFTAIQRGHGGEDWDLVSLESSEFDETGSADSGNSSLFPMLGTGPGIADLQANPKKPDDPAASCSLKCSLPIAKADTYRVPNSQTTPSPMLQVNEQNKTVKVSPTVYSQRGITSRTWSSPQRSVPLTPSQATDNLEYTPDPINPSSSSTPSMSEPCRYISLVSSESDASCHPDTAHLSMNGIIIDQSLIALENNYSM